MSPRGPARLTHWFVDWIRRSSLRFRMQRMRRFRELMQPKAGDRILDVGGSAEVWVEADWAFDAMPITILNLEPAGPFLEAAALRFGASVADRLTYVQGDGRRLRFADGAFDVVFSNSVLEHVGGWDDQRAFAREIERVGRGYWVQTPNRRFLIEPHFNFPAIQFLPHRVAVLVGTLWPFSFHKRYGGGSRAEIDAALRGTRLLDLREVRRLFPDSTILRERVAALDKSFVAYRAAADPSPAIRTAVSDPPE